MRAAVLLLFFYDILDRTRCGSGTNFPTPVQEVMISNRGCGVSVSGLFLGQSVTVVVGYVSS